MKKITLSLAALALLAAFAFSSCKGDTPTEEVVEVVEEELTGINGDFVVDPAASNLAWTGKKVTGEHFGSIKVADGKFSLEGSELSSGTIIVDMNSIVVEDIEDAEMNGKLLGHLMSEDFFNTAAFGEAKLEITAAEGSEAKGQLTIKGITESIKFPYRVKEENGKVHVSGQLEVDRTVYDIRYGSGKFFENLGDKTIDDIFVLKFEIVAQ
ncbi:MAG: YceI family protein [Chitinophagales bacterium]|nr:YceI family protein [Chitinophagales bacterium]